MTPKACTPQPVMWNLGGSRYVALCGCGWQTPIIHDAVTASQAFHQHRGEGS